MESIISNKIIIIIIILDLIDLLNQHRISLFSYRDLYIESTVERFHLNFWLKVRRAILFSISGWNWIYEEEIHETVFFSRVDSFMKIGQGLHDSTYIRSEWSNPWWMLYLSWWLYFERKLRLSELSWLLSVLSYSTRSWQLSPSFLSDWTFPFSRSAARSSRVELRWCTAAHETNDTLYESKTKITESCFDKFHFE